LSPADRALLVLGYLHDRSVEQVGVDLGRSPAAVRTGSHRALHRLRRHLGEDQLAELVR
jgi:DNA-directed RNA polymerase specialized sigma24 family protein